MNTDNNEIWVEIGKFYKEFGLLAAICGGNSTFYDVDVVKHTKRSIYSQLHNEDAKSHLKQLIVFETSQSNNDTIIVKGLKDSTSFLVSKKIHNNRLDKKFPQNVFDSLINEGYIVSAEKIQKKRGSYKLQINPKIEYGKFVQEMISCLRSNPNTRILNIIDKINDVRIQTIYERINITKNISLLLNATDLITIAVECDPSLKQISTNYKNLLNIPLVGTIPNSDNECAIYLTTCWKYNQDVDPKIVSKELKNFVKTSLAKNDKINTYLKSAGLTGRGIEKCRVRWFFSYQPNSNLIFVLYYMTFTDETYHSKKSPLKKLQKIAKKEKWKTWYKPSEYFDIMISGMKK